MLRSVLHLGRGMRRSYRSLAVVGVILGLPLPASMTQASAASGPGSRPPPPSCPSFSSGNFHKSTRINNPYFPSVPGTRFTYQGSVQKAPVVDVVYVTHNTKKIAGVTTVEVRDLVTESGVLTEDTLDWYAQDD